MFVPAASLAFALACLPHCLGGNTITHRAGGGRRRGMQKRVFFRRYVLLFDGVTSEEDSCVAPNPVATISSDSTSTRIELFESNESSCTLQEDQSLVCQGSGLVVFDVYDNVEGAILTVDLKPLVGPQSCASATVVQAFTLGSVCPDGKVSYETTLESCIPDTAFLQKVNTKVPLCAAKCDESCANTGLGQISTRVVNSGCQWKTTEKTNTVTAEHGATEADPDVDNKAIEAETEAVVEVKVADETFATESTPVQPIKPVVDKKTIEAETEAVVEVKAADETATKSTPVRPIKPVVDKKAIEAEIENIIEDVEANEAAETPYVNNDAEIAANSEGNSAVGDNSVEEDAADAAETPVPPPSPGPVLSLADVSVKKIEIDDATVTADVPALDLSTLTSNADDFMPARPTSEVFHSGEDVTDEDATIDEDWSEDATNGAGTDTDIEIIDSTSTSANQGAISVLALSVIFSVFVSLL